MRIGITKPFAVAAAIVGAAVPSMFALAAAGHHHGGSSGRRFEGAIGDQVVASVREVVETTSKDWVDVAGLDISICEKGPVTESFSAEVSGGPVRVRIVHGGHHSGEVAPLAPGPARFPAGARPESVESTFGFAAGAGGEDIHEFQVQWKSPSGAAIQMKHALVRLLYKRPAKLCA
jgi:hypothetical protein